MLRLKWLREGSSQSTSAKEPRICHLPAQNHYKLPHQSQPPPQIWYADPHYFIISDEDLLLTIEKEHHCLIWWFVGFCKQRKLQLQTREGKWSKIAESKGPRPPRKETYQSPSPNTKSKLQWRFLPSSWKFSHFFHLQRDWSLIHLLFTYPTPCLASQKFLSCATGSGGYRFSLNS